MPHIWPTGVPSTGEPVAARSSTGAGEQAGAEVAEVLHARWRTSGSGRSRAGTRRRRGRRPRSPWCSGRPRRRCRRPRGRRRTGRCATGMSPVAKWSSEWHMPEAAILTWIALTGSSTSTSTTSYLPGADRMIAPRVSTGTGTSSSPSPSRAAHVACVGTHDRVERYGAGHTLERGVQPCRPRPRAVQRAAPFGDTGGVTGPPVVVVGADRSA